MKKLLLWDIDGTLLNTDGAGKRAFVHAMWDCFGFAITYARIDMAGRTDWHIIRQLFIEYGVTMTNENINSFVASYLDHLPRELPTGRAYTYAGVELILNAVRQRADLTQGLLTGNITGAAHIKLDYFRLGHYFIFGVFGEESYDRSELGPLALRRAKEVGGYAFIPENVFIIGDTAHDIVCGQAIGAKTIAVATGFHPPEELAACSPTVLLSDLSDPGPLFSLLDSNTC